MFRYLLAGIGLVLCATGASAKGFHADVHGGVDHISSDGDGDTGAVYGIGFGYDIERARSFFGVEVTADGSNIRDCRSDLLVVGDRTCVTAEVDSALVARAGAKLSGGARLYALVGYALAQVKATYRLRGTSVDDEEDLDGIRLGLGAELPLSGSLSAKLEYRYTNYEQGLTRHQGLAGIGLSF